MASAAFTDSVVEDAVLRGPGIAAGELGAECRDPENSDIVLERRLRDALLPKLTTDELWVKVAEKFVRRNTI